MDFFSRLIGGHKPSASSNNPRQRLARFQQAYDRLLNIVQKSQSLHNDQTALESIRLSIQRLTAILHDESRSPVPHLALSFASSNQLYLNVSRIASSAYNEPVIREAVAFFGALIDSEEEEFLENERFAQCLMNFVDRISGTSNVFVGADTEVEIVELLFGIAAKIRLQPEILPVWFRQRTTQSMILQKEKEKERQGFAGVTQKEDFPLCYQLIDHVHHGGRIGDFARTGLLYVFESASKSDELEQWLVESDIPTLMASGLGALYSQMSRKLSISHPKVDMPIVLLLSDYPDAAPAPDAESVFSENFTTHMMTFLSYLQFWQDVLEHCNSVDVTQTLLDHFQVLFLQQLLYPSLLESSDADGGSSVAVLTYLRHILNSLEHPELMRSMLQYLLAISASSNGAGSEPSHSQRLLKRRHSLNLLASVNGADDQMGPSLFSLIDLLMSSLRSPNPETVVAALRLISTILSKNHSFAFGTLIKVKTSHSTEPSRTHGALNAEMDAYLALARGISNDNGLGNSYENLLKDVSRVLEGHTCSAALLKVGPGFPTESSFLQGSEHSSHHLHTDDAMFRYLLSLVETFLTNNAEVNLGLTETILTIASCRDVLLEGWMAVEPSQYVYSDGSADIESSNQQSLSASVQTLKDGGQPEPSRDPATALEHARRRPNWYLRHMPRLLTALHSAHAELASVKSNVPNFETLFSARKQAFQLHDEISEAIANAPPPLPPKETSTPFRSQSATPALTKDKRSWPEKLLSDLEPIASGTPSKSIPNRSSGSFAQRLLGDYERSVGGDRSAGRSKSPSKAPATPRESSLHRSPPSTPTSKEPRGLGSYGMIGSQSPRTPQPRSRALSPRPQAVAPDSSQLLQDVVREADSEILARRFQLSSKMATTAADGDGGDTQPAESSVDSKAADTKQQQGSSYREASLSHILTNAVILQDFELELVATMQVRASMFGEVKFA